MKLGTCFGWWFQLRKHRISPVWVGWTSQNISETANQIFSVYKEICVDVSDILCSFLLHVHVHTFKIRMKLKYDLWNVHLNIVEMIVFFTRRSTADIVMWSKLKIRIKRPYLIAFITFIPCRFIKRSVSYVAWPLLAASRTFWPRYAEKSQPAFHGDIKGIRWDFHGNLDELRIC